MKRFIKEIAELIELSIIINEETEHSICFEYYGHVDNISFRVYKQGFESERDFERYTISKFSRSERDIANYINYVRQELLKLRNK